MIYRCASKVQWIYNYTKSTGTLVEIIKIVILSDVNAGKQAIYTLPSLLASPSKTKQSRKQNKTKHNKMKSGKRQTGNNK